MIPRDPDIPALVAFAERGLTPVLETLGIPGAVAAEVLKYHPGSRCTLRVRAEGGSVAVKAFHRRPAREAEAVTRLGAAGLASGQPPTVAPLRAFDLELRLLAVEWLEGPTAFELIAAGDGARAGELAADWLRAAAEATVDVDRRYGADATLVRAQKWLRDIENADRELHAEAATRAATLAASPPRASREVLQHGSLSVHHVLDLGTGPGVLDLDELARGPIERDAGRFLATLTGTALEREELAAEAKRAEHAFRTALDDLVAPGPLTWYRAAAQLKLAASLCRRRPEGWRGRARALLAG